MTLRQLRNSDQPMIRHFLEKDRKSNLYLLDLLDRQGIDFWGFSRWTGIIDKTSLIALNVDIACLEPNTPCKMSVPLGDQNACVKLGENTKRLGGTNRILSLRSACEGFYDGLGKPTCRIAQNQRLFWTDKRLPGPTLPMRQGVMTELDLLIEYTALMRLEDEQYDPRERDYKLWRETVQTLITQHRLVVGLEGDDICFVIEIGTRCEMGAQIGSAYVPPAQRKRGFGAAGMRGIVQYLLPSCSMVTLLAHEGNLPAIACHNRAGFMQAAPFKLLEML